MAFFNSTHSPSFTKSTICNSQKIPITRWDLFACVAGRPEGIGLTRLAYTMHVDRERSLIVPLGQLEDEDLIVCDSTDHYILSNKDHAKILRYAIAYALAYGYDYNAYFEEDMIAFLKKAYRSDHFSTKDVSLNLIKPELIARLIHDDLLLVYQYEPFTGIMVKNPFLDELCRYLKIQRTKAFFLRKKISIQSMLSDHAAQLENPNSKLMRDAAAFFSGCSIKSENLGITALGTEIKKSIEKEDSELFDLESKACFERAWNYMHEKSKQKKLLDIETIKHYHKLTMESSGIPSTYRDHEVAIGNNPDFKTADPADIPYRLNEFINYLAVSNPKSSEEVLDLCAYAYNEFIRIHPFSDGNSRTDRIIMAHLLNLFDMPFEKIPHSFEVRFLEVTKGCKKRDDNELKCVLEEIHLNFLNRKELESIL